MGRLDATSASLNCLSHVTHATCTVNVSPKQRSTDTRVSGASVEMSISNERYRELQSNDKIWYVEKAKKGKKCILENNSDWFQIESHHHTAYSKANLVNAETQQLVDMPAECCTTIKPHVPMLHQFVSIDFESLYSPFLRFALALVEFLQREK